MKTRVSTVVLAGFLVHALLFGWSDVYGWWLGHGDFTPFSASDQVSPLTYDESQLYLPGAMRFARAGTLQPEVDVPELAALPNGYPVLHAIVIGSLAKVTGNIERAWILSHGLFPALLWLIIFIVLARDQRSLAVPAALATMAVLFPQGPRNMLLLGGNALIQPLELIRTPHPSLSYTLLIAFAVALSAALRHGRPATIALAGMALASLFYSYYFMWVDGGLAVSLMAVLFVLGRQWTALGRLLSVGLVGGVLAVPYLWRAVGGLAATTELGGARHLMERVGSFAREPNMTYLAVGAAVLVLFAGAWWWSTRGEATANGRPVQPVDRLPWVLGALIVAAILGLNFHVLTGYDAQHNHFINRVIQPTLFILACLLFCRWLQWQYPGKPPRWMRALAVVALVGCICLAGYRQTRVAHNLSAQLRASAPRNNVLLWLRTNVSHEAVVGTLDEELLSLLPGVAGTWNFVPLGDRSMASSHEILFRYSVVGRLLGLTREDVLARVMRDDGLEHNASSTGYVLVMERPLRTASRAFVESGYLSTDPALALATRRLDFVIAANRDSRVIAANPGFGQVYRNAEWTVYQRR